ncbi:MAG: hypothetical protein M1828_005281 [Chrysothrix sp. TS-e1954]|nr:MAG: hypothetical protein M1828_005281 [Chrysothrix sp. TS-e1954]
MSPSSSKASVDIPAQDIRGHHPPDDETTQSDQEPQDEKATSATPRTSPGPTDGGRKAWLAVFGGWCCLFVSFGWIVSIGVFEAYYKIHQLHAYSLSDISWILSTEIFILLFLAPFLGAVFDSYGPRYLLIFGTLCQTFGIMMLSLSDRYYQVFLSQSVVSAIGAAALFYAGNNAAATWFVKRRVLAMGIVASGSGLGGVVFPIVFIQLTGRIGFGWAIRVIGLIVLLLGGLGSLTVTSSLGHQPQRFNFSLILSQCKDVKLALVMIACFFFYLGFFLPTNYLPSFARANGLSATLANYQIVILNAASILGRIAPGWVSDKFGRFNVMIIVATMNTIMVLAFWIPSHDSATVTAFSAVYGFTSGALISLIAPLIAQISDIKHIGIRIGCTFFVISVSVLIGNPIGGALVARDNGGYRYLQAFCGISMSIGTLFFVVARFAQRTTSGVSC